ncbi:anthranilate phosphoribosyltransferase [Entomomonas asaccharolytica]|uniref:Anthranilate phosphoribosyltransferase n=1 Tax=Entomomonas asaccharolytica TaxID=2785331 RepID=A0A974NFK7_9GAMM|nr:anthranilate phosphoribosyltransferase [Entomomonas asaccharolytica]QQP85856.1 anthranilate phosphoribosyltransferase [Entomomonas asaccharolytica]
MDIKEALNRIVNQLDLTTDEMQVVMHQIMTGECTEAQIGAFMMGLRMKSETIEEIVGAAQTMRNLSLKVNLPSLNGVVDVVGTGGDGANIFNVSSATAFVTAAAGVKVAKHGNRKVSSNSGSADLLESAGIYLHLSPEQIARCIEVIGIGFMFAQDHHKAMHYAAVPRKELGLRSLFNILGPLTNPAGVKHHVIGVFSQALCRPMAEVLKRLGSKHALVVHSRDGLDEFSLASATFIAELKDDEVKEYWLEPEMMGLKSQTLVGLTVNNSQESLALIQDALGGRHSEAGKKAADMIILNTAPALYAADYATDLKEAVQLAQDALYSGLAREKMNELAAFTQIYKQENEG